MLVGRDLITGRMRQVSGTATGEFAHGRRVRTKPITKAQAGEYESAKGPTKLSGLFDEWLDHGRRTRR